MLALATRVVSDYGKVLARVDPGVYGLPQSLLPHPKDRIRHAIRSLLRELPTEHVELREGLARGYVYLCQFVDDIEASVIALGSASMAGGAGDNEAAEPAMRLINRIKLDMEQALEELRGETA
jgi:hypothetical protein